MHGNIVMSILSQNWGYLQPVSYGKSHMILKLRKLGIKCFKWIFEVEMREIWSIEAMLCKEHTITGSHIGPIVFGCLGSFFCAFSWAIFLLVIGSFKDFQFY